MPTEFEPVGADYTAVCVNFRNLDPTDLSRPPEYRRFVPTNTVVWDNERFVNPPPETTFNVTIELTEPVASISADVYAVPGATITLRAFDDTGAETGSATSMDSTDCCDMKTDTLTLANIGWIHLVTFQSSAPDMIVPAIDNLALERRTMCD